jgi:hypothetical protein
LIYFSETPNPLKNSIQHWKEKKTFMVLIKWAVENLKLGQKSTQGKVGL